MSQGVVCKCKPRKTVIVNWKCNYSAFNGYRWTPSDYSLIKCLKCGQYWRTKAKYVDSLPAESA